MCSEPDLRFRVIHRVRTYRRSRFFYLHFERMVLAWTCGSICIKRQHVIRAGIGNAFGNTLGNVLLLDEYLAAALMRKSLQAEAAGRDLIFILQTIEQRLVVFVEGLGLTQEVGWTNHIQRHLPLPQCCRNMHQLGKEISSECCVIVTKLRIVKMRPSRSNPDQDHSPRNVYLLLRQLTQGTHGFYESPV